MFASENTKTQNLRVVHFIREFKDFKNHKQHRRQEQLKENKYLSDTQRNHSRRLMGWQVQPRDWEWNTLRRQRELRLKLKVGLNNLSL